MRGTMGESLVPRVVLSSLFLTTSGRTRYTYSLVFAADMYATVFKKAPLDPKLGKLYRDKILLVGGSRDDMDSLKVCPSGIGGVAIDADSLRQDFLGREPNPMAFINEIERDAAKGSNL